MAVPCGTFGVVRSGAVVAQFPVPVDAYTAAVGRLFMAVEPATPPPSGPTVMESV